MLVTTGSIIRRAYQRVGILGQGESLPQQDQNDGLEILREMLDQWSIQSLMIPVVTNITFDLTTASEYTIGLAEDENSPANHIEQPRPIEIISGFVRAQEDVDYSLERISAEIYDGFSLKTVQTIPRLYYYEQGYPLSTIIFNVIPSQPLTLYLKYKAELKELLNVNNLTSTLLLPPGYEKAIIDNLAVDLAPLYGKTAPKTVILNATNGKRLVKQSNSSLKLLQVDKAITQNLKRRGTYIIDSGPC